MFFHLDDKFGCLNLIVDMSHVVFEANVLTLHSLDTTAIKSVVWRIIKAITMQ